MMDGQIRCGLAESALRITREMLQATETDSWEDLETLDEEREHLICALFEGLDPSDSSNAE